MITKFAENYKTEALQGLIRKAGADPKDFDLDEFERGYTIELEHMDITEADPVQTSRIALAHLREKSNYYTLLDKYVEGGESTATPEKKALDVEAVEALFSAARKPTLLGEES